jgi:hypothetical protein
MVAAVLAAGNASGSTLASSRSANGTSPPKILVSGALVRSAETERVFRIAGGAALRLTDCSVYPDCADAATVSQKALDDLPRFPADGTFLRATENGFIYQIAGGAPSRIFHFTPIKGWHSFTDVNQGTIDRLRPYPADGTFLRAVETGRFYRVAGGMPVPVGSCRLLSDCPGSVTINAQAITVFDHLRAAPADGTIIRSAETGALYRFDQLTLHRLPALEPGITRRPVAVDRTGIDYLSSFPRERLFLRSAETGHFYRIAGGAPLPITNCELYSNCAGAVTVDQKTIGRLPSTPAGGTFLRATENGAVYRVAGEAPLRVDHFTPIKGWRSYIDVNQEAIDGMPTVPSDGTFLRSAETGRYYRLAGGTPLPIAGCEALDGCPGVVIVGDHAIIRLVEERASPVDGTVLRVAETGRVYRIYGGKPISAGKCPVSANCHGAIGVSQLAIGGAFLRAAETDRFYRIAGSALLPVSDCKPLAGCRGAIDVTQEYARGLARRYPMPIQGTFLRSAETDRFYRIVGGALLPISNCKPIGGCPQTVDVNQTAIDRLSDLSGFPIDGTLLRASETGFLYKVVGGSPFPVIDLLGPYELIDVLDVNQSTIGQLRITPVDGTLLRSRESKDVYRVSGGSLSPFSCAQPADCSAAVDVNQRSIGRLTQLRADSSSTSSSKSLSLLVLGLLVALAFYLLLVKPGRLGAGIGSAGGRVRSTRLWDEDRNRLVVMLLLAAIAFLPTAIVLARSSVRPSLNGGEMTTLSRGLLVVFVLTTAVLALLRARGRMAASVRVLVLLLVVYWTIGALADIHQGNAYKRLSFFLVPLIIVSMAAFRPRYERALTLVMWTCIVLSAASLLLALFRPGAAYTDPARTTSFLFRNRLAGILDHANTLGVFAGLGVVLSFRSKGWQRVVGLPVCAFTLFASDSRGAWVATLAAICLLVAASTTSLRRGAWALRRQIGFIGSVAAVFAAGLGVSLFTHGESQVANLDERTAVWHFTLHEWTGSPIFGHGPGIWRTLIDQGTLPYWAGQGHDQFFETIMTTGIVGLLLVVAILAIWSRTTFAAAREGFWLPLALEMFVILLGGLLSPLNPWGANSGLWLLALVLFLDPIEETAVEPARRSSILWRRRRARAVAGAEPG